MADIYEVAVGFYQALKDEGIPVELGSLTNFLRGVIAVDISTRSALYFVALATLLKNIDDKAQFDEVFSKCFDTTQTFLEQLKSAMEVTSDYGPLDSDSEVDKVSVSMSSRRAIHASSIDKLTKKDFAKASSVEIDQILSLVDAMKFSTNTKRGRRMVASNHGSVLNLRKTVNQSTQTFGDPVNLYWLTKKTELRRIVFLVDISGSMEQYARAYLHFSHAVISSRKRIEVFTFGTRLTRITHDLSTRDVNCALVAVSKRVKDNAGGTRLGQSLREFNTVYGIPGMARGAIVVILSDGWERGNLKVLEDEMKRLAMVAYRIVWANPLKGSPLFRPSAKGMATALPYIDSMVAGHSFQALVALADAIFSK